MSNRKQMNSHLMAYVVFFLVANFYLYEFILQVSPAVMTAGVMRDFNVQAVGMGLISAAYFYSYTPMQIPAGILFDRIGPRMVLTFAVVLCAVGCWFFAMANGYWLAAFGRILMGAGSACSFVGILIIAARWFLPSQYALLVGIAQALSSVGAILGEYPIAVAVDWLGWRMTLMILAVWGLVLAGLIWGVVRDYPPGGEPRSQAQTKDAFNQEWQRLMRVGRCPQTWYIGAYTFFSWAPIVVFAGLWGVPYLARVYQTTESLASLYLSMIWVGIGIGSIVLGWWSDSITSRLKPLQVSALLGFVSATILITYPQLPIALLLIVLFGFGFAAGGQAMSFAVVKETNRAEHLGTASGINNMAAVAGGISLQPLVGLILVALWDGQVINGVPAYQIADYRMAFIILPLSYAVCWLFSRFLIHETNCQQMPQS